MGHAKISTTDHGYERLMRGNEAEAEGPLDSYLERATGTWAELETQEAMLRGHGLEADVKRADLAF
jgi:hypothetical protein